MKTSGRHGLIVAMLLFIGSAAGAYGAITPKGSSPFERNIGVGLLLGQPTAANGKFWYRDDQAVEMSFGYSWDGYLNISGSYLYHFRKGGTVLPYVGAGAVFYFAGPNDWAEKKILEMYTERENSASTGLRFPVGVEWFWSTNPVSFFAELSPVLGLVPEVFGLVEAGAGFRINF